MCIAADLTKYEGHAVQQVSRNIELIRYRHLGDDLLVLDLANTASAGAAKSAKAGRPTKAVNTANEPALAAKTARTDKTVAEHLATMPGPPAVLLPSLEDYVLSLGDDVQGKELKLYIAFKRGKNFATVVPQKGRLQVF